MDLKDPKSPEWQRFLKSFTYAWNGIYRTYRSERNFQFHVSIGMIVIVMGFIFHLNIFEWVVLLFLIGGMLALELMNTALEHVVDLVTDEYKPLAKSAKDASAGAVLVYAVLSAIIGVILFYNHLFQ
ncbi:diacylglycerol kinase family protein [Bacillus weihaiensis]|uniref:UDP kinase n=1 Tax=Bacillus weihaiensis TaxID=1547283 RepID=A0A1L3MPV2_9BACI|nr:diacylglycerol kinase family protein [Bacillus weihaiensis]APH04342.1 UDP kinase [Bacillus weihaiensis]